LQAQQAYTYGELLRAILAMSIIARLSISNHYPIFQFIGAHEPRHWTRQVNLAVVTLPMENRVKVNLQHKCDFCRYLGTNALFKSGLLQCKLRRVEDQHKRATACEKRLFRGKLSDINYCLNVELKRTKRLFSFQSLPPQVMMDRMH
jgi:hypothetical protein